MRERMMLLLLLLASAAVPCGAEIRDGVKYGISKDDVVFQPSYPQLRELMRHGGIVTVNLTIRDEQGVLVKGAKGKLGCWNGTKDEAKSDENGHLVLSATAFTDGGYTVSKEGYYNTFDGGYFEAPDKPFGFFERRRWKPIVKNIVLKKKRNPVPMHSKGFNGKIPHVNQAIGFDFKEVDWVKPYGKGKNADVYITVESEEKILHNKTIPYSYKLTFEWSKENDGVQICDASIRSEFRSTYNVDLKKPFIKKLVLTPGKDSFSWLPRSKYLVFRVRSETSPTGKLLQCHYGKIYPIIDVENGKLFLGLVFFNPTPNDINLEFDPKSNLASFDSFEEEQRLNHLYP